jgi:hypothetical protein
MTNKRVGLILVAAISLVLAACGSDSADVPSLKSIEDTQEVKPTTDSIRDDEAAMMALTECLREQGIEAYDPVVDAEGNVQKPQLAEGVDPKGEDVWAAWEMCAEHLEGITFEKERVDMSEQVDRLDQFLALATCLRDKGYTGSEPAAYRRGPSH